MIQQAGLWRLAGAVWRVAAARQSDVNRVRERLRSVGERAETKKQARSDLDDPQIQSIHTVKQDESEFRNGPDADHDG